MDIVAERCAGLDVHRSSIVACVMTSAGGGRTKKVAATFLTTAAGLGRLVGWLREQAASVVGMESTGVYWMPIYAALEAAGGFEVIVANAHTIKGAKGRKTDMNDAEWLASLVRVGMLRSSFVPPKPIRDLRDLTRYRRTLVEAQASERRRLIKLLEATDVKLAGVLSDVFGVCGRAILRALIDGEQTPAEMARLARGRLRQKRPQLIDALGARLDPHHRRLLAVQLGRVEAAEAEIAALDALIAEHLAPYATQLELLRAIPGIDWVGAATIIAEIGVDMTVFPSARHLAAWAGVCPGNHESAGKRKPTGSRTGNVHLKTALCNAAAGAARKGGSYFKDKYHKLKSRRGGGRATLAIAHKLIVVAYHILADGTPYRDLGDSYLDKRNAKRSAERYVRFIERLGFAVALTPLPETANPL
mgnify:CR=1 FL=1